MRLLVNAVFDLLVTSERVLPAKRLFVVADLAAGLFAVRIVDRILMPRKIVRSREDSVARLSSSRIYSQALVGTRLMRFRDVSISSHANVRSSLWSDLTMEFPLVLLKLRRSLEALNAPGHWTRVGPAQTASPHGRGRCAWALTTAHIVVIILWDTGDNRLVIRIQ